MKARHYQVNGDHYRKMAIQPFEFTLANDLGGVEHTIVKYVSRWREKGGIDDVRKARHCLDFLKEGADGLIELRGSMPAIFKPAVTADQYCTANQLDKLETEVVRQIYFWSHNRQRGCLERVGDALDALIEVNR